MVLVHKYENACVYITQEYKYASTQAHKKPVHYKNKKVNKYKNINLCKNRNIQVLEIIICDTPIGLNL